MKQKISVTLSDDLVRGVDRLAGKRLKRSQVIEEAVRAHVEQVARREDDLRELGMINQHAAALNEEMEDVLAYQAPT